jgi:hypothetical protein
MHTQSNQPCKAKALVQMQLQHGALHACVGESKAVKLRQIALICREEHVDSLGRHTGRPDRGVSVSVVAHKLRDWYAVVWLVDEACGRTRACLNGCSTHIVYGKTMYL